MVRPRPSYDQQSCLLVSCIRGLHNVTTQRMICELKYQINVSLTQYITSYAINKGRL